MAKHLIKQAVQVIPSSSKGLIDAKTVLINKINQLMKESAAENLGNADVRALKELVETLKLIMDMEDRLKQNFWSNLTEEEKNKYLMESIKQAEGNK